MAAPLRCPYLVRTVRLAHSQIFQKRLGRIRVRQAFIQRQSEQASHHIVPHRDGTIFRRRETFIGGDGKALIQRQIHRMVCKDFQVPGIQHVIGTPVLQEGGAAAA